MAAKNEYAVVAVNKKTREVFVLNSVNMPLTKTRAMTFAKAFPETDERRIEVRKWKDRHKVTHLDIGIKPQPTRLQKIGAKMKARHPGYADNPAYSIEVDHGGPVAALRGKSTETRGPYPSKAVADIVARNLKAGGAKAKVTRVKNPDPAMKWGVQVSGKGYVARVGDTVSFTTDAAKAARFIREDALDVVDTYGLGHTRTTIVNLNTRIKNPGDIHIDIHSHNTKGRNVRAKNPTGAFKPGDIVSVPWSSTPMRVLKVNLREDGLSLKLINAEGSEKRADGAWYSVTSGRQLEGRWYMARPGVKRIGSGKDPETGRARNPAPRSYSRPSWHQQQNRAALINAYAPDATRWKVVGGKDMIGVMMFDTEEKAKQYVENVARLHGEHNIIVPPETGRAHNPASVHSRAKGREQMVLKLVGHPKGPAWWTGDTWDTVRTKARIITGAKLADVLKMAEKLGKNMPARYRIEVHAA